MVLKDFGVKTQGHRCEAKRFRFVTFWGMWLVFSMSSIAAEISSIRRNQMGEHRTTLAKADWRSNLGSRRNNSTDGRS